ncbi:MAG: Tryptophan synthase alpha chain [Chromatiales bacterium USCg_Taylor]|nr:MAG: Tryptophan synthase alpha chain [Chromatiales bacterium USCg_Taylor]
MGRLNRCFDALRTRGRKALVPFITAGDPGPEQTPALMQALVESGADILELGVPFSDPMADGPDIQRSSERALRRGVTLRTVLDLVREFRASDTHTPIVLMGYLNPIEVMGYAVFARLGAHEIDPVFLLAPTSSEERIARICALARGFVYYVSLKGVTGSDKLDTSAVADKVRLIRRHTALPIGVGFGIKDAESAARIALISDAVVVGSALVSRIEALGNGPNLERGVRAFMKGLRAAMDGMGPGRVRESL